MTAPAGIQDGDILVFAIFAGIIGTAPTVTPPSGFSAPSGGTWPIQFTDGSFGVNVYVWTKTASGESGNYTATHAAASSQGFMFAVPGSTGTPTATTNSGTNGPTTTALGLTTTGPNALIAFLGWDWGDTSNNLSPPTGSTPTFTERIDVAPLIYLATGVLATAGATGNKSHTNNSATSGTHPWAGVLMKFESAGGAYTLAADSGSYAITGNAAAVRADRKLAANNGTYSMTGNAAALRRGFSLAALAGIYTVTGQIAALRATRVLGATPGTYTITGNTAILRRGLRLATVAGSYVITGGIATLRRGYSMAAIAGSYAITGSAAVLRATFRLVASPGNYNISGVEAVLTWSSEVISVVTSYLPTWRPRRR